MYEKTEESFLFCNQPPSSSLAEFPSLCSLNCLPFVLVKLNEYDLKIGSCEEIKLNIKRMTSKARWFMPAWIGWTRVTMGSSLAHNNVLSRNLFNSHFQLCIIFELLKRSLLYEEGKEDDLTLICLALASYRVWQRNTNAMTCLKEAKT